MFVLRVTGGLKCLQVCSASRSVFASSRSHSYHATRHEHCESAAGWACVWRLVANARPPAGWASLQVPGMQLHLTILLQNHSILPHRFTTSPSQHFTTLLSQHFTTLLLHHPPPYDPTPQHHLCVYIYYIFNYYFENNNNKY